MANLKLVSSNSVVVKERNFVGQIIRTGQRIEDRKKNLTRRYSCLDNAIAGLTRFMLRHGYVGDVCEVYHHITGLQLGTLKITAKGNLKTNWVWD